MLYMNPGIIHNQASMTSCYGFQNWPLAVVLRLRFQGSLKLALIAPSLNGPKLSRGSVLKALHARCFYKPQSMCHLPYKSSNSAYPQRRNETAQSFEQQGLPGWFSTGTLATASHCGADAGNTYSVLGCSGGCNRGWIFYHQPVRSLKPKLACILKRFGMTSSGFWVVRACGFGADDGPARLHPN